MNAEQMEQASPRPWRDIGVRGLRLVDADGGLVADVYGNSQEHRQKNAALIVAGVNAYQPDAPEETR